MTIAGKVPIASKLTPTLCAQGGKFQTTNL
ncbi:hypothetical protein SAMN05216197_116105 [Pseudomonas graminis]|uniref:Uncharacterized protein n=1 Tax=Pseudomonas graminis TaxID=158627 RepID=A0A1I0FDH6_9PSED|nr:hypothetical protein SAMN05216197_116105 [Pseudomonas graminis]